MRYAFFCSEVPGNYSLDLLTELTAEAEIHGDEIVGISTSFLSDKATEINVENSLLLLYSSPAFDGAIFALETILNKTPFEEVQPWLNNLDQGNWVSIGNVRGVGPSVMIDNASSCRALMRHLLEDHGYRDFLLLLGTVHSNDGHERARAFTECLDQAGPQVRYSQLVCDFMEETAYQKVLDYFQGVPESRPQVIVACNDDMAMGAIRALEVLGLSCPGDCAVTGFDDVKWAAVETPPLTTIRQPLDVMARQAYHLLRSLGAEGPDPGLTPTIIPTKLLLRESCGCPGSHKTVSTLKMDLEKLQGIRKQEENQERLTLDFSLATNSAPEDHGLFEAMGRLCSSLNSAAVKVSLFDQNDSDNDRTHLSWPETLVCAFDSENPVVGDPPVLIHHEQSLLASVSSRTRLPAEPQINMLFLIFNRETRLGILACRIPIYLANVFKFITANLAMGLTRVRLVQKLRDYSLNLEKAVEERSRELSQANASLTQENFRRRNLEIALEKEHRALESVMDFQPVPLVILSKDGPEATYFNHQFAQLLGQLTGRVPRTRKGKLPAALLRELAWPGESPSKNEAKEIHFETNNHESMYFLGRQSEIFLSAVPCRIVGMIDVTKQRQLEEELLTISERERARLGQELHDDICQQLAALGIYISFLGRELATKLGEPVAGLMELEKRIGLILGHVRDLSKGLFPGEVGQLPFHQVVENFLSRTESHTGLRYRLESNLAGSGSGLPVAKELHLFRVLQEAVQNTLKHAKASRVVVSLNSGGEVFSLLFEDDGIGLGPGKSEGSGFQSMRNRVSQIGGVLQVGKSLFGGVQLLITIKKSIPEVNNEDEDPAGR